MSRQGTDLAGPVLDGVDVAGVSALVRQVAASVVRPRFRDLHTGDVSEKGPGDLVTVVDLEAEAALTAGLRLLTPDVPVVGEEAVAADPALVRTVATAERVWVVDPIDGTQAFVDGAPDYAVMVALAERGEAVAAWICLPELDRLYVAVRGGGAWLDDAPLVRAPADLSALRGGAATRFLPTGRPSGAGDGPGVGPDGTPADDPADRPVDLPGDVPVDVPVDVLGDVRARVEAGIAGLGPGATTSDRLWSGATYARIASGDLDFAFYWRTNPWDHLVGAVLLRELGGVSRRPDGADYRAGDDGVGLVVASSPAVGDAVVTALRPRG